MSTITARYRGGVLIPDQPLTLREDERVTLDVRPSGNGDADEATPRPQSIDWPDLPDDHPFKATLEILKSIPEDVDLPSDLAIQHDHYLYGTPRRENP